ncbi:MAG: MMPL family transporter, partial [Actinobacteria bacterium]|nr:MMPL family transporter [Actinomycetota bacterium]
MQALTRFVLRHKLVVTLLWLAITAAGVATVSGTTHRMTNTFAMPGQAFKVDNQIAHQYGNGGSQEPYVPVLTVPAGDRVTSPAVAAETGRAFDALRTVLPNVRIADYATTHDPAFITRDGRSTFALVYTVNNTSFSAPNQGPAIQRSLTAAVPAGWHAGVTGEQLLQNGSSQSKGTGIMVEATIGALGALAILAFVFASFLALLPLLIGGVSVMSTFLAVGGLTEITGISQIVEFIIALIGLGVAIDYSLLVVSRWREERAAGRDNQDAVLHAMEHAGRAVVFSGLTVAIGLLAMIVLPVPMLRSVGIGGVLVPLVSVAAAITLLPVILATAGPRLDWPRLRTERTASRVFSAWARGVYRNRWLAAIGGLAVLGVLIAPALSLHLGEPGSSAEATSGPAHQALATLTRGGVPAGVLTPAEVLTTAHSAGPVRAEAARIPGVYTAVAPATGDYHRGGTAIVTVLPTAESSLPGGQTQMATLES